MPVSGDPLSPSMAAPAGIAAPAADQSPVKTTDTAQSFFQRLPPAPVAPSGKIVGAFQPVAGVAGGKPHGNGPARAAHATPAGVTSGTLENTGAPVSGVIVTGVIVTGVILNGMPYGGETAVHSTPRNSPGLLADEPPAIGSGNPVGDSGAGKLRLARPRMGTEEPSDAAPSAAAVPSEVTVPTEVTVPAALAAPPAISGQEETVLPGQVLPTSKLMPKLMSKSVSAVDAPGMAADPPGGLAAVPAGHPLPEGLAALFGASAAAVPSMGAVRGPAADAGFTALPATASGSVYPQIAPALVSLTGGPAGMQRLTLRLDPTELGLVHIRIDRSPDVPPEIRITADRPETLLLLQRDQLELHRALDHAGIPAEGRQVIFQAGAVLPDAPGPNSAGASSSASSLSAGLSAGSYSNGSGQGQAGQDGARSQPGRDRLDTEDFMPGGSGPATSGRRWLRVGVDIVA